MATNESGEPGQDVKQPENALRAENTNRYCGLQSALN
jgi:hypothetical protein